jgi:AraC-like DNA-binding protein
LGGFGDTTIMVAMLSPLSSPLARALSQYIDAHGGGEGILATPVDGLTFFRATDTISPSHTLYKPCLCVVAQGAKQVSFGKEVLHYDEQQCLIVSIDLPVVGRVTRASAAVPYLAMAVELDVQIMRAVMAELDNPPTPGDRVTSGMFVETLAEPLSDCFLRLVRMLEAPGATVLYPAIMREICFWLLTGKHGAEVCKLTLPGSHTLRIAEAINLLRDNFSRSIRVNELAQAAGMSASSFHEHFKALTSMTPLQYQKQLRLLEARRLILADGINVSSAAYQVGYESPSQFSREYSRMFGAAPKRDAMELKGARA